MMCASTFVNFWLRVVRPELIEAFVIALSCGTERTILGTPKAPTSSQVQSSPAFSAGGSGLASPKFGLLPTGRVGLTAS